MSPATLDKSGDTAVFTVIATTAPSADSTEDLVRHLRSPVIPDALKGTTLTAYVGGQTAGYIDLADRISDKLPLVIATVIVLSFLLLLIAFRSIVVPLTAGLMNLLSVGAAYGILTFVFQEGHGAQLIGLDGAIPIVSYVPLLMFAILFGLSMDYQVFLLTRIQEHYRENQDNHEAVVDGLAVSARVITSAALIMVSVYTSFILNGDPTVKQFGLGLAAAIAVDATVVRCLLVPAVMVMLGRANWWLPSWTGARPAPRGDRGRRLLQGQGRRGRGGRIDGRRLIAAPCSEPDRDHPEARDRRSDGPFGCVSRRPSSALRAVDERGVTIWPPPLAGFEPPMLQPRSSVLEPTRGSTPSWFGSMLTTSPRQTRTRTGIVARRRRSSRRAAWRLLLALEDALILPEPSRRVGARAQRVDQRGGCDQQCRECEQRGAMTPVPVITVRIVSHLASKRRSAALPPSLCEAPAPAGPRTERKASMLISTMNDLPGL